MIDNKENKSIAMNVLQKIASNIAARIAKEIAEEQQKKATLS
jgi:hypothetical protein